MKAALALCAAAAGLMTGCGSMSGLDASSSFSCKAPDGVSCVSISGTYANSVQDNLPFQQQRRNGGDKNGGGQEKAARPPLPQEKPARLSPRDMTAMDSGIPIRQPPLVLRVWVAPYEDDAGDLHDQAFFYSMVHSGKWMIEANKTSISKQFRPVFPLRQRTAPQEDAPGAAQPVPVIPGGAGQGVPHPGGPVSGPAAQ